MSPLLFGLTIQEITVVVSLMFGFLLLFAGIILFISFPTLRQPIELDFWGFKIKTAGGIPAVIILLSALFVGYPLYQAYQSPAKIPISGKIHLDKGSTTSGIVIGILPASYITLTQSDGSYSLSIPKGNEWSYQAIVYFPSNRPPLFHMDAVRFNTEGRGAFDHTLGPSPTK
jgi:hypothetical protein